MSAAGSAATDSLLTKIFFSTVLTLLLFAAIEFIAGLLLPSREASSEVEASEDDTVSATLAWLWINPAPLREDPDFLWSNQPHARRTQFINPRAYGSTAEWTIENNSHGFRGPELNGGWSAKDAYRVLCIGDSVTFGFNVDQDASYPVRLEAILRDEYPGTNIEVINAGVPGWTWLQGLRFLERRGLALKPDLVIMAHGVNDQLMRSLVSDAERLKAADVPGVKLIAQLRSLVGNSNVYRVIEQIRGTRTPPDEPSPGCLKQIADHGSCKRVSLEQIETAVIKASQLTASHGVDLIVLNLDFMKTPAVEAVRSAVEASDIGFVDLVHQLEFERGIAQRQKSDGLGLVPAGDRASKPLLDPQIRRGKVVFRVQVPDSVASYSARGRTVYYVDGAYEFNTPLNDEGRDGDEVAGDRIFSGTLTLPPGAGVISYMFYRDESREFEPLPPLSSSFGDRELHINDIATTPVFEFAKRFRMAEQTHPNAEGCEMVAKSVAYQTRNLPSIIHLFTSEGPISMRHESQLDGIRLETQIATSTTRNPLETGMHSSSTTIANLPQRR